MVEGGKGSVVVRWCGEGEGENRSAEVGWSLVHVPSERRACILLNVVIPSLAFTGRSISRRVHHPQVRISPDHSVFDSPTQLNAHNTPPALSDISGLPINSTQKSNLESVIFPFLSSKSPAITQQRLSRPFI